MDTSVAQQSLGRTAADLSRMQCRAGMCLPSCTALAPTATSQRLLHEKVAHLTFANCFAACAAHGLNLQTSPGPAFYLPPLPAPAKQPTCHKAVQTYACSLQSSCAPSACPVRK